MKIGSLDNKQQLAALNNERKAAGTANGSAAGAVGKGSAGGESTKVQISAEAAALASVDDGSFDEKKVALMTQQVSEGSYKVNPEKIADKLIANAQELLSRSYR